MRFNVIPKKPEFEAYTEPLLARPAPTRGGANAEAHDDRVTAVRGFLRSNDVPTINLDALEALVEQRAAFIADVNSTRRYRKDHVPGAVNLDPVDYDRDQLPADPATPLIFYCKGGLCGAARYAAKCALRMGFVDVRVFAGGIGESERAGLPVETEGEPAQRS